jgi:hypothetical protein
VAGLTGLQWVRGGESPLSVGTLLRATDSTRGPMSGAQGGRLGRCEGFRVDGADGRIGTVTGVRTGARDGAAAWLQVRTGLFVHRQLAIRVEDVRSVDPISRRIVTAIGQRPGGVG